MNCYSCATERKKADEQGPRDTYYKLMDQWYCKDCAGDEVKKWNEIVTTEVAALNGRW